MPPSRRPLVIVAFPPVSGWTEELAKLGKGNTVISFIKMDQEQGFTTVGADCIEDAIYLLTDADVILGAKCWLMDLPHKKYLTSAIREARLRKYGEMAKAEKVNPGPPDDDDE